VDDNVILSGAKNLRSHFGFDLALNRPGMFRFAQYDSGIYKMRFLDAFVIATVIGPL